MAASNVPSSSSKADPRSVSRFIRDGALDLSWIVALGKDPEAAADLANWPPHRKDSGFNWDVSTVENYRACHSGGGRDTDRTFPRKFEEARKKLDYGYHPDLPDARLHLQDRILSNFDGAGEKSNACPWVVFTAGAMGVGKSHAMLTLAGLNLFPLQSFVLVDPDKLKSELPEVHGYTHFDVESAATKLHRESTMMADILFEHTLLAGKNVLVDGSLRDVAWHKQLFARVRKEFPMYRIAIIHVTAPRETIFTRAAARAEASGRVVSVALLEESMRQVPHSVKELGPEADLIAVISNEDDQPLVLEQLRVAASFEDECPGWDAFQAAWQSECSFLESGRPPSLMNVDHGNAGSGLNCSVVAPRAAKWTCCRRGNSNRHHSKSRRTFASQTHELEHYTSALEMYSKSYPSTCLRCAVQDHAEFGYVCECYHHIPSWQARLYKRFEARFVGSLFRLGWYDSAPYTWKANVDLESKETQENLPTLYSAAIV